MFDPVMEDLRRHLSEMDELELEALEDDNMGGYEPDFGQYESDDYSWLPEDAPWIGLFKQ